MGSMNPMEPSLKAIERALKSGNCVWIVGTLRFPSEGEAAPLLAPAPFEEFGWSEGDYMASWNMQVGYLLRHHAVNVEKIELPSNRPISPHENPPFLAVRGWR